MALPIFFFFFFLMQDPFLVSSFRAFFFEKVLISEFMAVKFEKGGENMTLVSLFYFIVGVNYSGLLPYTLSLSSHMSFSMSMAVPIWAASLFVGYRGLSVFMARFVLPAVPLILSGFLVIVEFLGLLIRPIALFIRLSVNMTVGHVLLSLLGDIPVAFSLLGGTLVFLLESMVCLVQGYVYVKLLSLYCMESVEGH